MDPEQEEYLATTQNRLENVVSDIIGMTDADDRMMAIMETLNDTVVAAPDVGRYYTFIYDPKTPRIRYDQFPLIACVGLFRWGFRGINFHWQDYRNYTWEEIQGKLHVVEFHELDELLALQYGKFLLNK